MTKIILFSFLTLFLGCATYTKFPVSKVTPAADISAKKKINSQKNFSLEIIANNLADANRLNPPGNNYSVWIVTKSHGIKNVGQLNVENAEKTVFKTVTPFDFDEVFITIENQGDSNYPLGVEIARTKI
jgi:hypothetical protein